MDKMLFILFDNAHNVLSAFKLLKKSEVPCSKKMEKKDRRLLHLKN